MSQRVETRHKQIRLRNPGQLDGAAKPLEMFAHPALIRSGILFQNVASIKDPVRSQARRHIEA